MKSNKIKKEENEAQINSYYKWGQMKIEKLSDDIDINRLRLARPILIDEPLFSSCIKSNNTNQDHYELKSLNNQTKINKSESSGPTTTKTTKHVNLQPNVDSYIINTIKLNRILNNNLTFEQIEYFMTKTAKNKSVQMKQKQKITTDVEARHAFKQFIVIMCLHSGFTQASSLALDILVEVLDDYISAFFKLLKNLQQIHQADPNKNDPKTSLVQYNHYSSELYIKQAFEELGIGSVEEIRSFYQNDIINYHQETFKKVTKLYDDYKARKLAEKLQFEVKNNNQIGLSRLNDNKTEGETKVEEFMRENDFLNDESNMILDELLTDLNETHFDEGMSRLLQMIGSDPFSLMPDDHL